MKIPFLKPKPSKGDDQSSSPSDNEKDFPNPSSQRTSIDPQTGAKKEIEVTPLAEVEALDKLDDEIEYPSGAKLGIITLSLCLSVFLMALVSLPMLPTMHDARSTNSNAPQDNTIIATAIPKITDYFGALDDVGWYGSGKHLKIKGCFMGDRN